MRSIPLLVLSALAGLFSAIALGSESASNCSGGALTGVPGGLACVGSCDDQNFTCQSVVRDFDGTFVKTCGCKHGSEVVVRSCCHFGWQSSDDEDGPFVVALCLGDCTVASCGPHSQGECSLNTGSTNCYCAQTPGS